MANRIFILLFIGMTLTSCNNDEEDSIAPVATPTSGYTLSGHISVASNTTTDADLNDPNATYTSNDSVETAQAIPNPVILGGYVNQPGKGEAGRSRNPGDVNDFYAIDLLAGQRVDLFVANENLSGNDLDLALLDRNGVVLNASVGETDTESLIVPLKGRYLIQIRAFQGASNYVLSVGQNLEATSTGLQLNTDFAVGEAIVKFKQNDTLTAQSAINTITSLGLQTQSQDPTQRMLFTFDLTQQRTLATEGMTFETPELQAKYETLLTIKELRKQPTIEEASPNYWLTSLRVPNDALYRYQWDYLLMKLPQAWDVTVGDANVLVAVVDTGVLLSHPDLQGKLVEGYDFVGDTNVSLDGDGYDSNPDDPGDQNRGGSTFHGTHVSGTIGALTNNAKGIAGISWLTKIMPLRVLGKGGAGKDYDIEQAIRFAAGLSNASGALPRKRADVINLSLGGPTISSGFQKAIDDIRKAGVIVVAAAGNDGTSTAIYPASLNGVISVSAVDINKERASYSNYGKNVDITAPGGDNSTADVNGDGYPDQILSTRGDDEYSTIQFDYAFSMGTSMASPHIAGVLALMKAANPNLTPQDADNLISNGEITEDLGLRGRDDNFGYGLIDAQKAILAASQLQGGVITQPAAQLVTSHNSLNLGLSDTNIRVTFSNGGGGTLQIQNIYEDSNGFLTISPLAVDTNRLGDYEVTVNRNSLGRGTHTATITVVTNVNTLRIPVMLQVGDQSISGDAGHHYILLINPTSLETILETRALAVKGIYDFKLTGVPSGTYILAAGSDFNNDGFICDLGEACGAFLTLSDPISIDITSSSKSRIDFGTGFNVSFLSQLSVLGEAPVPNKGFARLRTQHELSQ